MKTLKQIGCMLLALVLVLGIMPFSGLSAFSETEAAGAESVIWFWPVGERYGDSFYAEEDFSANEEVKKSISSPYGTRDGKRLHRGIDIRPANKDKKKGETVYAAYDGSVYKIGTNDKSSTGKYVILKHEIDEKVYYTVYMHLSKIVVEKKDDVTKGQKIAEMGNTGEYKSSNGKTKSYGVHLHFEICSEMGANGGLTGRKSINSNPKVINDTEVTKFPSFSRTKVEKKDWEIRYTTKPCSHKNRDANGDCLSCNNHDHIYDKFGHCVKESCEFHEPSYYDRNSFSCIGTATPKEGTTMKVKVLPYSAADYGTTTEIYSAWFGLVSKERTVEIEAKSAKVIACGTNHYNNTWYTVTVDGISGEYYVFSDNVNVEWKSSISISDVNYPKNNTTAGNDAKVSPVKGVIESPHGIVEVKAAVYLYDDGVQGKEQFSHKETLSGRKTKYKLQDESDFNNKLAFRKLEGGHTYRYIITVKDAVGMVAKQSHDFFLKKTSSQTTYKVTFQANGGTGGPSSVTVAKGSTITLSNLDAPGMAGARFLGWAEESNAESPDYMTSFKPTGNITLYAVYEYIEEPKAPTMTATTQNIAVGRTANIAWNTVEEATEYTVNVYDANGEVFMTQEVRATMTSLLFETAGVYTIRIVASNIAGSSEESTSAVTVIVHEPSTVTFLNYDGTVWTQQEIAYGESAVLPTEPTRTGYTFDRWDGSLGNVKADRTLTAIFTKEYYRVTFYDCLGEVIGEPQLVSYTDDTPGSAIEPDVSLLNVPEGYAFAGWDTNAWQSVTEDNISVYPVYIWGNAALPLSVEIGSVEKNGDGYWVNYTVENHMDAAKTGRVVIVLKSIYGKFLTNTESNAFYLSGGEGSTISARVYVPLEAELADSFAKAEAYVVDSYNTMTPVSEPTSKNVYATDGEWSKWMTEEELSAFGMPYSAMETKTQYRYRMKESVVTDTDTYLDWELESSQEGYSAWSEWGIWQDTAISETDFVEVETQQVKTKDAYKEYRYGRYRSTNCSKGTWSHMSDTYAKDKWGGTWQLNYTDWSTTRKSVVESNYQRTSKLDSLSKKYSDTDGEDGWKTYSKYDGTYYYWNKYTVGGTNYYWEEYRTIAATYKTQYRSRTRTLVKENTFFHWQEWSDWCDGEGITIADNMQLEERTLYRVKLTTEADRYEYELSGSLNVAEATGKQGIFVVYKVDEASDYSNEYMEQVTLGENGAYSFRFDTRETPSLRTGDFTAIMIVEGSSTPLYLATIEAPKPQYTVKFVDMDGSLLGEAQTVEEGGKAVAPEIPLREGYTFLGWEYGLTNIRDNMEIHARYAPNTYSVVFVDWANRSVSLQAGVAYGTRLDLPEVSAPEGYSFLGWQTPEGLSLDCVTDHMIVTTDYEQLSYEVRFLDAEGNVVHTETVLHGEYVEDPFEPEYIEDVETESEEAGIDSSLAEGETDADDTVGQFDLKIPEGMYFCDWSDAIHSPITKDEDIRPVLLFEEDAAEAEVDLLPGIYEGPQTITISSIDPDAEIMYHVLSNDEEESLVAEYTGPITVARNTTLEVITSGINKNETAVLLEYVIVPEGTRPNSPTELAATDSDTDITVTWKAVDNADGYILDKVGSDGTTERFVTDETEWVDVNVFEMADYTYTVRSFAEISVNGAVEQLVSNDVPASVTAHFFGKQYPISSIDIDGISDSIVVGNVVRLDTVIRPSDAYCQEIKWQVQNGTGEATVSETGVLLAESEGTATIVAQALDGSGVVGTKEIVISRASESKPDIVIDSATVYPGSPANISVQIDDSASFAMLQFAVLYDPAQVQLTEYSVGNILQGQSVDINADIPGIVYFAWDALADIQGGGSVLDLRFEATAEHKAGEVVVTIPTDDIDYPFLLMSIDATAAAECEVFNGVLSLREYMLGDVNGDISINVIDANMVRRYTVKTITFEAKQLLAADVNGDGVINVLDANLIRRYAAKLISEFPG